ncbi:MAG TPA: SpoIIE family protein phosphatase [Candidatus Aminicenantes bacterium]|nr:SpoIIE family protein phosphatase [Candidatus Aminicenantes bacterium]HRY65609.1 SpoIIE family protein phosphatase [Candidatus Aminicenantes bacterium]HRZ72503.1 SpoIIE family protein phosphatase [Candidatus Aminicenantes bacterium]
MSAELDAVFRQMLADRRSRLDQAASTGADGLRVQALIRDVDDALARLDAGAYGLCEVCREPIETERLIADPLSRFCLDHLTPSQQRALESDLGLAARIQKSLLPGPQLVHRGWEAAYHYQPAGLVSGDYCDLVPAPNGDLYFILGDVVGKGVAASMLMVHLQAMFRTMIPMGLPLRELVEHASRVFCQSILPNHYATLVCGRAAGSGEVEICNAGHPPPLLISEAGVAEIDPTGVPIGAFCDAPFATTRLRFEPGQALLLYTDGLSEARDEAGRMYGSERVRDLALRRPGRAPREIIDSCLADLEAFRRGVPTGDDLTIMAIRRSASS